MSEQQEVPSQIGKMLGQLVEHQQHFGEMSVPDREWAIRNTPAAIDLFAGAVKNRGIFSIVATTFLDSVPGKPTKDCFSRPLFDYHAGFDGFPDQPTAEACVIVTVELTRRLSTFATMLSLVGHDSGADKVVLGNKTIKHCYTMTFPQAEEMAKKSLEGKKTGMKGGNFFFVETGNPKDPVSVGAIVLSGMYGKTARIFNLDSGNVLAVGSHFLIRNLDSSIL